MADVKVNLTVSSSGTTAQETKQAAELADQLERGTRAATALSRVRQATPVSAALAQSQQDETSGYRQFRGASGTGASARDFSKEAAGLGGLVHVYATFAANIFALSEAFRGLKEAYNTADLVKGLDQLGASSGRNLSSLAKQLSTVTDGAITFKQSLEATAIASSAGLSSDQILRIGEVAKKSSQALGRDLPDALNRLILGITKSQPKLLDELGILVKVGEADTEYARTLGKTSVALTDLERQQAFTTAAITQGEKKFKDINLVSNPYTRLEASAASLAQTGLSLLNTVLAPIASLLASSPTALSFAIAGIAGVLLKQAIPALGAWRSSLAKTADEARKNANTINESFKAYDFNAFTNKASKISDSLAPQKKAVDTALTGISESARKVAVDLNSEIGKILATPVQSITSNQITQAQKQEEIFRKTAASISKSQPGLDTLGQQNLQKQAEAYKARADGIKEYVNQLPVAKQAVEEFSAAQKKADQELDILDKAHQAKLSEAQQRQRIADRAQRTATTAEILSNVGTNTQTTGIGGAFTSLKKDIAAAESAAVGGFNRINGTVALIRGSFAIATSAIATFLNAFGPWAAVIGIAITATTALVDWLGTNNKQVEEFKSSIESLNASIDLMANTIETTNKKSFLEGLTVEGIQARSTAIQDLSGSISKTISGLLKADETASSFDRFVDEFKKLWGGDLRTVAVKGLSGAIEESLKGVVDGQARAKLVASLGSIFNTTDISTKGIQAATSGLSPDELKEKLKQLSIAESEFAKTTGQSSDTLVNFKNALSDVNVKVGDVVTGLNLGDATSKAALSIINFSNTIKNTLEKGPINSIIEFQTVINKATFLPPATYNQLQVFKKQVDSTALSIRGNSEAIDIYREQLDKLEKSASDLTKTPTFAPSYLGGGFVKSGQSSNTKAIDDTKALIDVSEKSLQKARDKEKELSEELNKAQISIFEFGANLLKDGLKRGSEQAAITIAQAALSGVTGQGAAEAQYRVQVANLEIQKSLVQTNIDLATNLFLNSQILEKAAAETKLNTLQLQLQAGDLKNSERISKEAEKDALTKQIGVIEGTQKIIESAGGSALKALDLAKNKNIPVAVSQTIQAYASPLLGGQQQLTALNAQEQVAKNAEIVNKLKEQSTYKIAQNNLDLKDIAQAQSRLDILKQSSLIDDDSFVRRDTEIKLDKQLIDNDNTRLNIQNEIDVLSKQISQSKTFSATLNLALQDKQVELTRAEATGQEAINQLIDARNKKLIEQSAIRVDNLAKATNNAALTYGELTPEDAQKANAAIDRQALVRHKASEEEIRGFDITQKAVEYANRYADAIRKLSTEFDIFNDIQDRTDSIGVSLSQSFGKVGSSLAEVAKAFTKSATDQVKINQKLIDDKLKNDTKYGKDKNKLNEENTKLETKAALDRQAAELDSYANMAGAAASFFDQKTVAFKAFHAIETALTLESMALKIAALAVDTTTTAGFVANSLIQVGVAIKGAIAKALDNVFPYNLAAAAVVVATAASFGLFSGSGSVATAPTAEQAQKIQGSGSGYDSKGNIVATGGGALGDISAISKSITDGIATLSKVNFELLDFTHGKMYDTLVAIRDNTQQFVKAIATTTGITGGNSAFGTTEGSSKSFLGFSSSSTSVTDTGIIIKGVLQDLINGGGIKQQYENVHSSSSSFFGLFNSSSDTTNIKSLTEGVNTYVKNIFTNFSDTIKAEAGVLGTTTQQITDTLDNFNIDIKTSAKGLTGDEFATAVMAEIGIQLDKAATAVFPQLTALSAQFQNLGESTTDFVIRLGNDTKNVSLAFQSIGKSFNYTGEQAITISETLVKAAGGLDNFVSSMQDFSDNFLTDAQKLAPVQKAVTEQLAALGLSAIDSRQKFADLVLSLDLTKASDQALYTSLMGLEKGFAAVYTSTEDLSTSAQNLVDTGLQQAIKVMDLLGDKVGSTNLQRQIELKGMDASLKATQLFIYALEDEATARDTLQTAYDAEVTARQASIDSLKASRDTLLDFSKTLAQGATSPLTPQQKYAQAKSDLAGITSVINDSLATKEDKAAAVNKLPGAISTFLETSKVFNASSAAFQQDYAYSQKLLDSNTDTLTTQLSVEQDQLDSLKKSVIGLGLINDSVISVYNAIGDLKTAIDNSTKAGEVAQAANPDQNYGANSFVRYGFASTPGLSAGSVDTIGYFANLINTGKETNSEFLQLLPEISKITGWYNTVLHRDPETAGLQFWLDQLNKSGLSEQDVKKGFAYGAAKELGLSQLPDINAFAKGGLASGLSLVGEDGPEFVDFTNPGRVYSNSNSQNMFSDFGGSLTDELKALREEVAALRAEAKINSANEIGANFASGNQVGNMITEGLKDVASRSIFNSKNQAELL